MSAAQKPPAGGACASSGPARPEPEGGDGTPLERAADAAEELYRLRDTFFPQDPDEKTAALRARADAALALLDAVPPEQKKSPQQRGVFEFLRGKILDAFHDYNKEAEDHLSKAVKLNPSLVDAWLCLGNCIWKKGDLSGAKNCFQLALSKGLDKKILCQLSMLERSMAQDSEDQALLMEDSIKHAKEAVMLDIKDGNSWYNMGNAYLTSFFVGGAWDHTKLHHSVKAYQNAEKDKTMSLNPDLYYNCATADKYLENYERALRGFEAAALKDPGLGADTEVQKIISLLDKLENAMKGQLRSKRLASLVSSLSRVHSTVSILSEGLNKAVAVLGKVVLLIRHDNVAPLYYLTCDLDQSYFILSVYGLRDDAIKEGDRVVLFEPYYRILDASLKDKVHL
ncbi:Tetratricopeptide repeat protein 5 [Dichanthelium oligosanthes]|uniref:Tetratricopeptide repeat protein 5 n=1 Tax=Dichanthelium oligosanthes TaxID=888268 RepID=A0A1E5VJ21_9POAL|nr:Tetratricopeptide repeat protein 5 [Dichanthelium oligosanthes]